MKRHQINRANRRLPAAALALVAAMLTQCLTGAVAKADTHRAMTLGLGKSDAVDLPEDIREVVISDPTVVEAIPRTARRVQLIGQKIGQASASFVTGDGRRIVSLDISVERDLAPVAALIKRLMPTANVRLESLNDNIVLMGTATNPLDASRIADIAGRFVARREQVLNMVDVEVKEQVALKVKVAEMNRSVIQRLGVDIREALASGNIAIVKMVENGFPLTGASAAALPFQAVTSALGGTGAGTVAAAGWSNGSIHLDAILQALERNGLARTLAEPTLTSVSGETAKFLAGGEYPVPVGSNREGITISFKSFGVSLAFTPVVLSAGRISMQVATEVSELTTAGAVAVHDISIPALSVRRASSTLELPSGGSLVMAGLISSQTRRNVDGLPGLRELPVLGALFRSEEFVRHETELVVIVTPYLVKPADPEELTLPGGGEAAPPAALAAVDGKGRLAVAPGTNYGYIVE
jgi:pilus assembly protein CpaC